MKRALLLTVGTGDLGNPEDSLFAPLRKSMAQGEWSRIVLLPSQITVENADRLKEAAGVLPVEIAALTKEGDEDDADACFAHFDAIIGRLCGDGFEPTGITPDFTRGTKAMSAALVLAAVRHALPRLRYITGPRDERGMVQKGQEQIRETHTANVTARRRLDLARDFITRGQFAAALDLLPDPGRPLAPVWPQWVLEEAAPVRLWTEFYACWDRLDYKAAAEWASRLRQHSAGAEWQKLRPTEPMLAWIRNLAAPPQPSDHPAMSAHVSRLICDMLANGERRLRDRQFEDAVLRAYRVLELIGQARLFKLGYDSARLPAEDGKVKEFQEELKKRRGDLLGTNRNGTLNASREKAARLLHRLGDDFGTRLTDFDSKAPLLKPSQRNLSVLIHGFAATGGGEAEPLAQLYAALALLIRDHLEGDPECWIETARSLALKSDCD
jgi:CRISPR-associated protein (TIGR02710 family)